MGRRGVVLPVVGPPGRAVVAQSIGYEAMVRGNPLALRLPIPKIHPGPMDKDDWRTNAVIDVGQIYAVHPHFRHSPLRSLRFGPVWPRCTKNGFRKGKQSRRSRLPKARLGGREFESGSLDPLLGIAVIRAVAPASWERQNFSAG